MTDDDFDSLVFGRALGWIIRRGSYLGAIFDGQGHRWRTQYECWSVLLPLRMWWG